MPNLVEALGRLGIPTRDLHDLPSSSLRFPDGAHYRIEIAGVEGVPALQALIDESGRRGTAIHRVIATVGGATLLTLGELKDFAALAKEAELQVVMTPGSVRGWDTGRQLVTSEGLVSGYRLRGADSLAMWFRDVERCLEAGMRGFLVVDEGVLWALGEMKKAGVLPPDVVLKCSVFAGHGNPAGAKVIEGLGASSFNPLADLSLAMLASIRKVLTIPMDVYVYLVDAMGGFNRFWEAAEIARVCAPVYLKIEPGPSEAALYKPWVTPEFQSFWVREKVKHAAIVNELVLRQSPEIKVSGRGPADLTLPQPGAGVGERAAGRGTLGSASREAATGRETAGV